MTPAPRPPLPLRRRFALLATLLGLLLSVLAAGTVLLVGERYEYLVSAEVLRGQADDYGLRLANGLPSQLPRTQRLRGYRWESADLPPRYARLPLGVQEDPASDDIHVGVFDTPSGRLVFTIDLGDIEALERQLHLLVAAVIVLGTLLAGWLGWLLSGIAIRPLHAFADAVEALPAEPRPTHLAAGMGDDELGRLAGAIDGYQARLVDADAREQAFLADASHELRTPLAVVRGAVELLQDDADAHPGTAVRLQRLDRGVTEMAHLLEAMLAAARRKPLQPESADMHALLHQAATSALAGKPGITERIEADGSWTLPTREALLLVSGLVRKLVQGRQTGRLWLSAHASILRLEMEQDAAGQPESWPARADAGSGSALLDRLAARLGWRVDFVAPGLIAVHAAPEPSAADPAIPPCPTTEVS